MPLPTYSCTDLSTYKRECCRLALLSGLSNIVLVEGVYQKTLTDTLIAANGVESAEMTAWQDAQDRGMLLVIDKVSGKLDDEPTTAESRGGAGQRFITRTFKLEFKDDRVLGNSAFLDAISRGSERFVPWYTTGSNADAIFNPYRPVAIMAKRPIAESYKEEILNIFMSEWADPRIHTEYISPLFLFNCQAFTVKLIPPIIGKVLNLQSIFGPSIATRDITLYEVRKTGVDDTLNWTGGPFSISANTTFASFAITNTTIGVGIPVGNYEFKFRLGTGPSAQLFTLTLSL